MRFRGWLGMLAVLLGVLGALVPGPGGGRAVADSPVVFDFPEDCSCQGTDGFTPAHLDLGPGRLICQWNPNTRYYWIDQHTSPAVAQAEFNKWTEDAQDASGSGSEIVREADSAKYEHIRSEKNASSGTTYYYGGRILLRDAFTIRIGAGPEQSESEVRELFTNFQSCAEQALAGHAAPAEEEYYIYPGLLNELRVGEVLQFSVITEAGNKVSPAEQDEFSWVLVDCKSSSDYLDTKTQIGSIDSKGAFTAVGHGTCQVSLRREDKTVDRIDVKVACPQEPKGDLDKVLELYRNTIPTGPILEDVKTGKASPGLSKTEPGYANNMLSVGNDDRYGKYTCGGYQRQVLTFLTTDIQASPEYCTLLNGYDFMPIFGWGGGHHSVVVFPAGSDWRKTGTVADPWLTQRPAIYTIDEWWAKYAPIGEELFESDIKNRSLKGKTVGSAICPVDLLVTDSQGRRLGVLDNGSMVAEIPDSFIGRIPDGEDGSRWYFELGAETSNDAALEITGTSDGAFELTMAGSGGDILWHYSEQPIAAGATAKVRLDAHSVHAPLPMPDGIEVQPEIVVLEAGSEREATGTGSPQVSSIGPTELLCVCCPMLGVVGLIFLIFVVIRKFRARGRDQAEVPSHASDPAVPLAHKRNFCTQCGEPVTHNATFCTQCGSRTVS